MKKALFSAFLLSTLAVNAQIGKVGVNTDNPKATLDIQPSPANSLPTATTNEGLLIPKLSKTRVANIATPEDATMIYVSDVTYTGTNPAVADITSKGFYYYDADPVMPINSRWKKLNVNAGANLYNTDGALTDNRNVDMNGKNLSFIGTGNVGIGTNNPRLRLSVESSNDHKIRLQHQGSGDHTDFVKRPNGTFAIYNGTNNTAWKGPLSMDNSGFVGIGTETPDRHLQVMGGIRSINLYLDQHIDANHLHSRNGLYTVGNIDTNHLHSRNGLYTVGNVDTNHLHSRNGIYAVGHADVNTLNVRSASSFNGDIRQYSGTMYTGPGGIWANGLIYASQDISTTYVRVRKSGNGSNVCSAAEIGWIRYDDVNGKFQGCARNQWGGYIWHNFN